SKFLQQGLAPTYELDRLAIATQLQAGFPAPLRDGVLVARQLGDLFRGVFRTVREQAVQQEYVEEVGGFDSEPDRAEGVEIETAHLDVLDAGTSQRAKRAFARADAALGPDRPVELVFDLQQAGRQLAVAAVLAPDAE